MRHVSSAGAGVLRVAGRLGRCRWPPRAAQGPEPAESWRADGTGGHAPSRARPPVLLGRARDRPRGAGADADRRSYGDGAQPRHDGRKTRSDRRLSSLFSGRIRIGYGDCTSGSGRAGRLRPYAAQRRLRIRPVGLRRRRLGDVQARTTRQRLVLLHRPLRHVSCRLQLLGRPLPQSRGRLGRGVAIVPRRRARARHRGAEGPRGIQDAWSQGRREARAVHARRLAGDPSRRGGVLQPRRPRQPLALWPPRPTGPGRRRHRRSRCVLAGAGWPRGAGTAAERVPAVAGRSAPCVRDSWYYRSCNIQE